VFFVEEGAEGHGFDRESAYTSDSVVLDTGHCDAVATETHEAGEVLMLKACAECARNVDQVGVV
jgi:hypothetical protein